MVKYMIDFQGESEFECEFTNISEARVWFMDNIEQFLDRGSVDYVGDPVKVIKKRST